MASVCHAASPTSKSDILNSCPFSIPLCRTIIKGRVLTVVPRPLVPPAPAPASAHAPAPAAPASALLSSPPLLPPLPPSVTGSRLPPLPPRSLSTALLALLPPCNSAAFAAPPAARVRLLAPAAESFLPSFAFASSVEQMLYRRLSLSLPPPAAPFAGDWRRRFSFAAFDPTTRTRLLGVKWRCCCLFSFFFLSG